MKMKKIATGLVVLLAVILASTNLSAQNFSSILEKLINLEERLSRLETTQGKLFMKLHNQLSEGQFDEEAASLINAVSLLKSQVNRLIADVELIDAGNTGSRKAEIMNAVEMESDEAIILLNEIMTKYGIDAEEAGVEPEFDSNKETSEINGFVDFFNTTVQNKLNGVTFEAVYTSESSSNMAGGLRRETVFLDNVDLNVTVDFAELFSWRGATFFLYGLGNRGGSPSENIGDAQGVSNIDADDTWKIYEAWFQQELFGDKLSILSGLYDLNSEFDVIEAGGLFLNSSHGIGPDFSQTGLNGPSIFPNTSFGLRVRVQPLDAFYIQTVLLDGVSGDPDNPAGTQVHFGRDDGILFCTEVAHLTGTGEDSNAPYGKIALGVHYYTTRFDKILAEDAVGNPQKSQGSPGFYLLAERKILSENAEPAQGLAVYGRIGFADSKVNQFRSYLGGGVVYTGLFPGRNEDQIGFSVASARNGSPYKTAQFNAGTPVDDAEVTLELTYHAPITSWLSVQPDFQYVINPGMDPGVTNAFVFGTRFEISL